MNTILVALAVGCIVGLFVGSRLIRTSQPQITVVQVEPDLSSQRGCMPLVAFVLFVIIIAIVLSWR